MKQLLLIVVLMLSLVSCGGKKSNPGVGGNNDNNEENNADRDLGNIFPDVGMSVRDTGDPDVGTGDMGPIDMSMPEDMSTPEDMSMQDMPVDMMMNCPRSDVADGEPCACNQECTSGVCVDASASEDGFCSIECESRADCPDGETCVTDRFGQSVCRADDTGADCTDSGQPDPAQCSASHCVQAGSNFTLDYFCSVPCATANDCMLGHACVPVRCQFGLEGYRCLPTVIAQRASDPDLVLANFPESTKLCVSIGAANPCGDLTMGSDEQACPGSICDPEPSGRCTAQCVTTNDCPAGGCVDYDLSNPTLPIRVCDL